GGSSGQSARASRTLPIGPSARDPVVRLAILTVAPVNVPRVCAQSAVCFVPPAPQRVSIVFAPPEVTVPRMPRTVLGRTLPPAMRTTIARLVRKVAERTPSDVSVRVHPPSVAGVAVYVHCWFAVPVIVSLNSVGAGAADACAASAHVAHRNARTRLRPADRKVLTIPESRLRSQGGLA